MIEKITNNLGWKIVSVVLAFFLWLAVVNSEDPIISKKFENVPVDKTNESVITTQKKAISSELGYDVLQSNVVGKSIEYVSGEHVDVTVKGNRSIIEDMTINDIYAYVDMENLSITNAIDIEIVVDDDIELVSVKPANMIIELEDVISVQKEVQYYFEGETTTNYIALDPEITPSIIQITGPESNISQIASVIVPINIEDASKDITLLADPQILNSSSIEIDELETNIDEVEIYVPIEKIKIVPIKFIQTDEIQQGYQLMEYYFDEPTVVVRGSETAIDDISEITVDTILIADMIEDTTVNVSLADLLPEGVNLYSDVTDVTLTFMIEKIVQKEISILNSDIIVKNLPEGMQFSFEDTEPISITIEGVTESINAVTVNLLNPYISLADLEEGSHEVLLNYYIPSSVTELSEEQMITILLEEEVVVEDTTTEEVTDITTNNE
jgi:YbbR domain-containing protein